MDWKSKMAIITGQFEHRTIWEKYFIIIVLRFEIKIGWNVPWIVLYNTLFSNVNQKSKMVAASAKEPH